MIQQEDRIAQEMTKEAQEIFNNIDKLPVQENTYNPLIVNLSRIGLVIIAGLIIAMDLIYNWYATSTNAIIEHLYQ